MNSAAAITADVPTSSDAAVRAGSQRLAKGAVVCGVLLVLGYLLFVWTDLGHQIDATAYFGRDIALNRVVKYDHRILGAVSEASLLLVSLIVFAIGWARGSLLVGAVALAGIGVAVVGAEVLKRVLPWEPLVPMDRDYGGGLAGNSYPSGHTTIGTSLALAFVLVAPARWRPWLAVAAGFVSASYATGVVFAGWHRPSDAIGGILWAGTCLSVAGWIVLRTRGRDQDAAKVGQSRTPLVASGVAAVLMIGISIFGTLLGKGSLPDADSSFVFVVIVIVCSAFTLSAWYGWRLRSFDWR